jgi:hypothetical protein
MCILMGLKQLFLLQAAPVRQALFSKANVDEKEVGMQDFDEGTRLSDQERRSSIWTAGSVQK